MTLTGWGRIMGGFSRTKLVQVNLRTFDSRKCSYRYKGFKKGTRFCAAASDGCRGDAGAPLLKEAGDRWYQFGIVSSGKYEDSPCQKREQAGVFIRVAKYCRWIAKTTKKRLCETPPPSSIDDNDKPDYQTNPPFWVKTRPPFVPPDYTDDFPTDDPGEWKTTTTTTRRPNIVQPPGNCGTPFFTPMGDLPTRVVGGQESKPHSWPWQVSIQLTNGEHKCGGTLISNQWILTAAHCTDILMAPKFTLVKVGAHDLSNSGEDYTVAEFIKHPDYDYSDERNDIALMKLSKPVTYGQKVHPICLPREDKDQAGRNNIKMLVSGWGDTITLRQKLSTTSLNFNKTPWWFIRGNGGGGDRPTKLLQVTIKTFDFNTCSNQHDGLDEKTQFCASSAGRDSCQGDSGGPLIKPSTNKKYYQYGVVSYGGDEDNPCDNKEMAGVYTRVARYCDWIAQQVGQQLCVGY